MTIASTTNKVSYNGNGSTVALSVPFYFLADADLVVTKVSTAGVETTLTTPTYYSVTGAGNPAGGTVTMVTAPATGEKTIIKRSPAQTQETDYVENAAFPAVSHEMALDRLTMICQDLDERLDRSVQVPISSTTDPAVLIAQLSADAATAAAAATTATTQAGLATTARTGAETAQGLAEDARDAAQAAVGGVKVSSDDTTAAPLATKLVAGTGITLTVNNDGGNETLTVEGSASFGVADLQYYGLV